MNYTSNYIVVGSDFYNILKNAIKVNPLKYTDDLIKLYFKNGHIRSLLKKLEVCQKRRNV